jgi:hypothetical protein
MEWITGTISWIFANWDALFQIVGVAATIATLTPNKSDDKFVQMGLDAINSIGMNFGKAGKPAE